MRMGISNAISTNKHDIRSVRLVVIVTRFTINSFLIGNPLFLDWGWQRSWFSKRYFSDKLERYVPGK
jgi:hypothetical protein